MVNSIRNRRPVSGDLAQSGDPAAGVARRLPPPSHPAATRQPPGCHAPATWLPPGRFWLPRWLPRASHPAAGAAPGGCRGGCRGSRGGSQGGCRGSQVAAGGCRRLPAAATAAATLAARAAWGGCHWPRWLPGVHPSTTRPFARASIGAAPRTTTTSPSKAITTGKMWRGRSGHTTRAHRRAGDARLVPHYLPDHHIAQRLGAS